LARRRLVAVDGTCLDVADTPGNAEFFGRPGVNKGEQAAFPQARVVALAECGTHAVFAAQVGAYTQSEATLTATLLDRLEPGMLLVADRGLFSYACGVRRSEPGPTCCGGSAPTGRPQAGAPAGPARRVLAGSPASVPPRSGPPREPMLVG
jgi:hypothetical protein